MSPLWAVLLSSAGMPRREAPGRSRALLMAHLPQAPSPSLLTAAWLLSSG